MNTPNPEVPTDMGYLIDNAFEIKAASVSHGADGNWHFVYLQKSRDVYVVSIAPNGAQNATKLG